VSDAVDLGLLRPLDEFTAAVDELSQAVAGTGVPDSAARERIDAADTKVKAKALALQGAVLDAFDTRLGERVDGYAAQRRALTLAAVIVVLAAVTLLWLRAAGRAVPPPVEVPDASGQDVAGRHSYPGADDDAAQGAAPRIPDLVDVRDLLAPQLARAGRAVRGGDQRNRDDHQ
jgi:hypothetical protein